MGAYELVKASATIVPPAESSMSPVILRPSRVMPPFWSHKGLRAERRRGRQHVPPHRSRGIDAFFRADRKRRPAEARFVQATNFGPCASVALAREHHQELKQVREDVEEAHVDARRGHDVVRFSAVHDPAHIVQQEKRKHDDHER